MYDMSDREAVIIMSKIRDCRFKKDCDMNCEKCSCNYTNEQLNLAVSKSIDALLERDNDGK